MLVLYAGQFFCIRYVCVYFLPRAVAVNKGARGVKRLKVTEQEASRTHSLFLCSEEKQKPQVPL